MGTASRDAGAPPTGRPSLVFVTTVPLSADVLLRGQLGEFRRRGYEVTVVSSPGSLLEVVSRREGVATAAVEMRREISPAADIRALLGLCRLFREIRPMITSVGTPKAGLLGGLAALLTGVPCRIYVLHGLRLEAVSGPRRWVLWAAEWIACRCAQTVVCVGPSLLRRAESLQLLRKGKAIVLRKGTLNGVDYDRFTETEDRVGAGRELRTRLGIPQNASVVGFVGRITQDKGILDLIAAYRLLQPSFPDLYLLLVGAEDPADPLPIEFESLVSGLPRVVGTGWLEDPTPAYHAMNILALPTYREGIPGVALQAAAAGRPVVTTSVTGAVDAVVDGVTGVIVPPRDPSALADAVGQLLSDPGRSRRMGELGRERVQRDFRPEDMWNDLDFLFQQLLQRGTSRAKTLRSRTSVNS
jgi:glycosyltransferase involved in cell wall biosynthesis